MYNIKTKKISQPILCKLLIWILSYQKEFILIFKLNRLDNFVYALS